MEATYGRTKKSMRNSVVALAIQFAAMLVGFFSRKIFIDYLGTEVLGLNTTATSILNGLNLLELGIWSAISVTLYKPLYEKDDQAVKEIIALQGWLYKIVASIVILGSLVVMAFFPQIFSKSSLPLWYPYATFGVLLYSSVLTYFVNYKRNALYADQQNYKVLLCSRLIALVKLICQALTVRFFTHGYIWWVVLEAVFATLAAVITQMVVYRSFPYLREKVDNPAALRFKYPQVLQKIKYLSFHKLGSFAISQIGPIIIYGYATLTLVAYYGNYMVLTANLLAVLTALYAGMEAGIGNMVAEGDRSLTMRVFGELFSSRILVTSICSLCLWILADPFISVWLGAQYVLPASTRLMIVLGFFMAGSRTIAQSFVDAHGAFQDIWAPVAEVVLNVGLSILGSRFWGLDGILGGALLAQIALGFFWKPYFLFRKVLDEPLSLYVRLYTRHALLIGIGSACVIFLSKRIPMDPASSLPAVLLYSLIVFVLSVLFLGGLLYLFESSTRGFVHRIFRALKSR